MYNLDINKGDIILRGKYRNKKEVVKTFGHDEKGQPTINGKRILNFNIEKLLPKREIKEMKKSELKNIIKECMEELNEAKLPPHLQALVKKIEKLPQDEQDRLSKVFSGKKSKHKIVDRTPKGYGPNEIEEDRDYKAEYQSYHGKSDQKKESCQKKQCKT